ncbi:MAG: nucleotide exchange factor GrpE, partial [Candidatus Thorarchaeota archaeon]
MTGDEESKLPEKAPDATSDAGESTSPPEKGTSVPQLSNGELLQMLQRTSADFDNYRKRMEARILEITQSANERLLLKFLEVYDNLQRALQTDFAKNPKAAWDGVSAIERQMWRILEQEGIRPIESIGRPYDPYYQHSVSVRTDTNVPDGHVVEEYLKGY